MLKTDEELANKKVRTPRIGDEKNSSEVSLEHIQTIIHARVEEILVLVKNSLNKSGIHESLGTGIVITGGMSRLIGIKELALKVFDEIPVKISNPMNIKNGYMSFDDPKMATIVGLLLYSLDTNRNFELDSNKNLIRKRKIVDNSQVKEQPENFSTGLEEAADIQKTAMEVNSKKLNEEDDSKLLPTLTKKDKNTGVKKLWNAITEWF